MDELKSLIEAIAGLPQLAVWVVVAFWAYKVIVIGSIFGVVRLGISKAHDLLVRQRVTVAQVVPMLEGIATGGTLDGLKSELKRAIRAAGEKGLLKRAQSAKEGPGPSAQEILSGMVTHQQTASGGLYGLLNNQQLQNTQNAGYMSPYFSDDSVDWLRQAIDDKIAKDRIEMDSGK